MSESVKVAVRVRPFNKREKELKSSCCVAMEGQKTSITDANGKTRDFTFDYSYWSHDGFEEKPDGLLVPVSDEYADQQRVFNDLGRGVLENAFAGYNTSLFAYGQTGSGKSYSMVGYSVNKGIVPITCEALFDQMEKANEGGENKTRYSIKFSMLEIYNEKVRDLLAKPSAEQQKHGLKVAENTKTHKFEVKGLKSEVVHSYKQIENLTEIGTKHRTVASTKMNNTSSRAHTIISILFEQITKEKNRETTRRSEINLVDLAGSERAGKTGAEGERLKEGANINKSLGTLGKVIQALAKGKAKHVPYRESVLTKLLMNALGGNSKTVMIAALSPASDNFEETLSTLRYADQAKQIKNKATVNESATERLIRELREEIELLKNQLLGGGSVDPALMERMAQMQQDMTFQTNEVTEAPQTQAPISEHDIEMQKKQSTPYLTNLNEDPALSGVVSHFVELDEVVIASFDTADESDAQEGEPSPFIYVSGFGVRKRHAVLTRGESNSVFIEAGSAAANTKINGTLLTEKTELKHNDRVLIGSNCLMLFLNPLKTDDVNEGTPAKVDYQFAQEELTKASGLVIAGGSMEEQERMAQIMELFPMVTEINAISDEMNKSVHFEVQLVNSGLLNPELMPQANTPSVMVKVEDTLSQNEWFLTRGQFVEKRFDMQEMYGEWAYDGDENSPLYGRPANQKNGDGDFIDPFYFEPSHSTVGIASVLLLQLSMKFDQRDTYNIVDQSGKRQGEIEVALEPCDETGTVLDEDSQGVDDASDLLDTDLYIKATIVSVSVTQAKYSTGLRCKLFFGKFGTFTTEWVDNSTNPTFNASNVFCMPKVTREMIDWLEQECIYVLVETKHKILEAQRNRGQLLKVQSSEAVGSQSANKKKAGKGGSEDQTKIKELEAKLQEMEVKLKTEKEEKEKTAKNAKEKAGKKSKEVRRTSSLTTKVHTLQTKYSDAEKEKKAARARAEELERKLEAEAEEKKALMERLQALEAGKAPPPSTNNTGSSGTVVASSGTPQKSSMCTIL